MSGEWKPGDVAMVTARWIRTDDHSERYAIRRLGGWFSRASIGVNDWEVSAVRPLVVIDPEDAEQVERLVSALHVGFGWTSGPVDGDVEVTQAALRELAAPAPPRPEEPQGLGAVVEDAEGRLHIRTVLPADEESVYRKPWSDGPVRRHWQIVDAVRVLSEGVTP